MKNFNAQPGIKIAFQNSLSQTISWGYNAGLAWNGKNNFPFYIYTFSNGIDELVSDDEEYIIEIPAVADKDRKSQKMI